jgi:hypothetical protein
MSGTKPSMLDETPESTTNELLSDAELLSLGRRALDALHAGVARFRNLFGPDKPLETEAYEAWTGLRAAAAGLVAHHHTAAIPALAAWAASLDTLYRDRFTTADMAALAVEEAGAVLAADPDATVEVCKDPRANVRAALVPHLDPALPEHEAALRRLAGDARLEVRQAAQKRLGGSWPSWGGLFDDDPTAHLDTGEAEQVGALFDTPEVELHQLPEGELQGCIARLRTRDQLGAQRWVLQAEIGGFERQREHALALAALDGRVFAEVCVELSRHGRHTFYVPPREALATLPLTHREAALESLGEAAAAGALDECPWRALRCLEELAADLSSQEIDPGPLLVLALGGPLVDAEHRETPSTHYKLLDVLSHHPLLSRYSGPLAEADRRGRKGAFATLPSTLFARLLGDGRERAEAALASGDRAQQTKAVTQLLGELHEEAHDAPARSRATELYDDPRTRPAVLGSGLGSELLAPRLRQVLAQPERVDVLELAQAMRALASIDGGLAGMFLIGHESEGRYPKAAWETLRRGWEALGADARDAHAGLYAELLPPGPGLDPRDEARARWLLDRSAEASEEGDDREGALARTFNRLLSKRDDALDAWLLARATQIPDVVVNVILLAKDHMLPPGLREAALSRDASIIAATLAPGSEARFP